MDAQEQDEAQKALTEKDYDAIFDLLNNVQHEANEEYIRVYSDMVKQISDQHFAPLAKIIAERETASINIDVAEFQSQLLRGILSEHEDFWQAAGPRITHMEMLKAHYNKFQGATWDFKNMTPEDRLLPFRIATEKSNIRNWKSQIEAQETTLKKLTEKVDESRARVQQSKKHCNLVLSNIQNAQRGLNTDVESLKEIALNELHGRNAETLASPPPLLDLESTVDKEPKIAAETPPVPIQSDKANETLKSE